MIAYKVSYQPRADKHDEFIEATTAIPGPEFFRFILKGSTVAYIAADSILSVKLVEVPEPLVSVEV